MSLRRNIKDGQPVIEQISTPPRVYLDNCALVKIKSKYDQKFIDILNKKNGTLCLSFFNIIELINYGNEEKREQLLDFVDSVDLILMDVNPDTIHANRSWLDMDLAKECEKVMNPLKEFKVTAVIRHMREEIERFGQGVLENFETTLYPKIQKARVTLEVVKQAKLRRKKKGYVPINQRANIEAVHQACFDFIVVNKNMKMDTGEWRDTFHTIVPVCSCDFVLIDTRWTQFLVEAGLSYPQIAKTYDERKIEDFLIELENFKEVETTK